MFEITKIERQTSHLNSGFGGTRDGWFARVLDSAGGSLEFSKLDGETEWFVDAVFTKTGLPLEVHGFGSRCCAKKAATGELKVALEVAAAIPSTVS